MEFAIGGLNITARDYAKLGQLYLDSGRWNGRQVVPEEWVLASTTPDAPHLLPSKLGEKPTKHGYGYQWWIPAGADDEFNAQGIYGQLIYVDPDQDVVLVKLSSNYHYKTDKESWYHYIDIALTRTIIEGLPK